MKQTMGILALLLLGLALAGCKPQELPVKPTPTAVAATAADRVPSAGSIVAGGRVIPVRSVTLSFASGGIVAQAPVALGEQVVSGEVLSQLDTGLLELQLAQAEASLAGAQARLDQLAQGAAQPDVTAAEQNITASQATYDRLAAGASAADVAAAKAALAAAQQNYAQVRAGPGEMELAQLKALADNARAALDQAQAAYDQVKDNANVAMLPQSTMLQQATNSYNAAIAAYNAAAGHPTASELATASAQVQAAQAALDRLAPDPAQVQAALAALENARAQLAQLQREPSTAERAVLGANLRMAQAGRDLAAAQLRTATLLAPFAGSVMKIDIAPGEYAGPGAPVILLADLSAWQIETTDLTELNVAEVSDGAQVTVTFDALPDLELPGHVSMIEPYGESRQGDVVYAVGVTLDRQDPRLRWNMTAKVSIQSR